MNRGSKAKGYIDGIIESLLVISIPGPVGIERAPIKSLLNLMGYLGTIWIASMKQQLT
jgi:hypothetical protein